MSGCAECGGVLKKGKTTQQLKVAGRSFTAELPAEICKACGGAIVDHGALEAFELAIAREIATSGASSGEAFKFMRKALGYRAADLAELLGVAAETVSRWETGQRDVDRGALVALGSLVLDRLGDRSATLERLRALREPPRLAKVVTLDVTPLLARRAG